MQGSRVSRGAASGLRGADTRFIHLGFEYDTFCVNPPVYCANLLRSFIVRGGKCVERHLHSEWEAYDIAANVGLVVNASGMGFGDSKCFPTRGQTVLTNLEATGGTVTRQNKDGSWSFIIPRFLNGGTVIGGTKQPRDSSSEVDPATRELLLRNACTIESYTLPSSQAIDTAKVIADIVGLRPTREGGMRIEAERNKDDSNGVGPSRQVVHAYGAGGRGFETSWGVAELVAELVADALAVDYAIVRAKF
ncbi:hypothetical protein NQ176_g10289 [Zarea fungicola]|uniref:Uncharacterized protein n=1 Tax=Zarea fungicola TaxID=93591 RepID=A0ACC1MHN2_9HYPO|nr:hypothetical protein NQ176_g10289 [Lecanicillium fungicola]